MIKNVDEKTKKELIDRVVRKRGSITKPIIDEFIASNQVVVQVPLESSGSTSFNSLYLGLKSYIKNHKLPVQVFMNQKKIYLRRTNFEEV